MDRTVKGRTGPSCPDDTSGAVQNVSSCERSSEAAVSQSSSLSTMPLRRLPDASPLSTPLAEEDKLVCELQEQSNHPCDKVLHRAGPSRNTGLTGTLHANLGPAADPLILLDAAKFS